MTTEVKSFDPQLDQQLREGFSSAKLRLSPDANVADLHAKIAAAGFDARPGEYGLQITRKDNGAEVNVSTLLNALARKEENATQFILPGGEAQHLDQLTTDAQKTEYIKKHGVARFEQLVADSRKPALRSDVILHRDMDRAGIDNLTRAERVEFISRYGDEAYRKAYGRVPRKAVQ